jgi:TldD protein
MLTKKEILKTVEILEKSCARAKKLKKNGFPSPYYSAFTLRDTYYFSVWANNGALYRQRAEPSRFAYCDLRVGSYAFDQTTDGGLKDNDDNDESYRYITMPCSTFNAQAFADSLWKLSEIKYREALTDYSDKKSSSISNINPYIAYPSFHKLPRFTSIKPKKFKITNTQTAQKKWVDIASDLSNWISKYDDLYAHWVDVDIYLENKIFVNSEHRSIVQGKSVYTFSVSLKKYLKEGSFVDQSLVLNRTDENEIPALSELKKRVEQKYKKLQELSKAKKIHSFSGPVLLYPKPAGLLFHEAIGHRLEGSRLLSQGEGQTFKGQVGEKVLDVEVTIRDNPKLRKFNGIYCTGSFDFDDEGSETKDAMLIEKGVLKGFLTTRASIDPKKFTPNGHARNARFQRPISRMGVTIIEAKSSNYGLEDMKKTLIQEIKDQNKPFGLIVYETTGGETHTSNYDFQGFSGEIAYATLIDRHGKETPIRGVKFVGTPLQALSNIIAVGKDHEIDNSFCGAESGFIPVTTISPATLIRTIELQAKDEDLVAPFVLKKPVLSIEQNSIILDKKNDRNAL